MPIIIGAIILPSNSPNFTQMILKGVKILELRSPKIKKIVEKTTNIYSKPFLFKIDHAVKNKKTKKNRIPKLLFEFFLFIKFLNLLM